MSARLPTDWARSKRSKLQRYAEGDVGRFVRAARDVMMRGVPVAYLLGFAANGSVNENTTGWISCSPNERAVALVEGKKPLGDDPREGYGNVTSKNLHELGPFGVEGGYVPDLVATGSSPWAVLAKRPCVRKVLGRDGVTGSAWHGAVEDQCVIGVANLARHGGSIVKRLDARLRWELDGDGVPKVWSPWAFAVTSMAWSAGDGGAAAHLARCADTLASVPEAQRWGAFVRLAATYAGDGVKHRRPSYSALRTCQKLAAGRLACEFTGEAVWADDGSRADDVMGALVDSAKGGE